ncbi:helix-turn-helix domain-containing protein [Halostella litorea]|uniref:helix-turn-helix domain-containing protein n=1 Tax=Halostella litorea TaxID=2528831 RepID=UPI001092951A|nr:helix-turn-helix domain-containing protein [Halostella litorea]
MPQAQLTLTVPEETWIGDLSRSYPDARVRILAALADEAAGVGLAEIAARDLPDLVGDMAAYDEVIDLELLQDYEDEALVQFETTMPLLLFAVQDSGVPLELPFDIVDGAAEWTVTAPQDRLSELGEQLDTVGVSYTVDYVQQTIDSDQLLTDHQLNLVRTAVEVGYYDTPRTCSLTELAEELDIAKSTCSESLHRAEEKIVKQFLEDVTNS